jgi:two-component system, cell cycle sensor histidine kinase and response regulator CckA
MFSANNEFDLHQPFGSASQRLLYVTSGMVIVVAALLFFWWKPIFSDNYLPHAYCYLQKTSLVWTNVAADTLIGLSYTAISISLALFVFKGIRDIPFRWMFLAFGLFIVACGGTHFVEAVTVWIPVYVFAASVKVVTAIASLFTAIALPFVLPQARILIREARVSGERRQALEFALKERNAAQEALRETNRGLEQQVSERTSQLAEANSALQVELAERRRVQASMAMLAFIVESSDDAIIGTDLKGTITSWNRGAETIYGYSAQEVIGRPITIIAPADRTDEVTEILSRVARGDHMEHYETERVTKSGVLLDVSLTVSPVHNSENIVIGLSSITRDITAAKRAERALRESEAQYRLLFDCTPLPMWVFDRKTLRFLAVNEAAVRQYGFSRDQFFRMTILDIRPPEDTAILFQKLSESKRGLRDTEIWRHRKKDGTIIDVEITTHDFDFHGVDAELVLAHDVTERRKSEERLRQSQERFSKAFRSSPLGITISSEDEARYIDANPAYLSMMGYERDELVGRTVQELGIWVDPQHRHVMIEQLDRPQSVKPIEVEFRQRSGQIRVVQIAAERIVLDDRRCVLAFIHDVTEERKLEQQFRQAQKMEAIGRLAGGIAHDFNNLLGVIIGFSDVAMEHLESGHPVQKNLEEIRKAGERAAALTWQLLAFSRQQVLEPRTLNLNSVVHNVSKMLLRTIGEDISLVLRPAEPLGSVRADLGQIEQVLMNLAVNARDAMPDGGKIVIETSNVDLDETYARQHESVRPGAYVLLSVSDTGIGMDEATKAQIFEPFFTTKEPGKGTGLGLSTVYGIVKQSEGYIWVYSELRHGTTFKIYFPRVDRPAESLVGKETEPIPGIGAETILVVEDDDILRGLTVSLLETGGYKVLSSSDAPSAVAVAQQHTGCIDLLVTDVIMPGVRGPDLATELKKGRPEMKVLYVSGYAGNVMVQQGVLGPDAALLVKPFSKRTLLTKVRAVIES